MGVVSCTKNTHPKITLNKFCQKYLIYLGDYLDDFSTTISQDLLDIKFLLKFQLKAEILI